MAPSCEVDLADGSIQQFGDEDLLLSLTNRLQYSPDGATLYAATMGLSSPLLATFDATTSPPTFQGLVDAPGDNAADLILSHNGRILTIPSGAGNGDGYGIRLFDTADLPAHFGTLQTGAYPHNGAFNQDDTLYYTAPDEHYGQEIQVYSVETQQRLGGIRTGQGDITHLMCDGSGRYLFCLQRSIAVANEEPPFEIHVFATGEKPFKTLAGTYALTVTDVSEGYHSGTLTLLPTGAYSGSLRAHGRSFSFTGNFLNQAERAFSFSIAGLPPVILQLESAREPAGRVLRANLDVGAGSAPLSILKRTDFKSGPPAFAGTFTWHAAAETGEKLGPSTGRIVVKKSGAVLVSGVLGDYTRITQGGFVADGDKLVLNAPLFGGKGYFGGLLRFREVSGQSDADATVSWVRPPLPKSTFRPEGFALTRALRASKYTVPTIGNPVLPFEFGEIALVSDSQNSLSATPVSFVTRSSIVPLTFDLFALKARVSIATGGFSGSFKLPDQPRRITFTGQVFQKTARAVGVFKTDADYGTVSLVQD